jgi:hypothetical protein
LDCIAEERVSCAEVIEKTPRTIDQDDIESLGTGRALVLHVRAFVDPITSQELARRAENHGYSPYLNVPSVRRIGMAFYETEGKKELIEQYFETARKNIQDFRDACAPYQSPIDGIRCLLDEIWSSGAMLQTLSNKKMFVGLSRMVKPGTTFLAHHDIFENDALGAPEAKSLLAQFGANVYIQMPESGGELLMWRDEIPTPIFDKMRGSDYGVKVEVLGKPDLKVRPNPGDLLIFNSRKMHAVAPGTERNRLALSCFVGYRGINKPLSIWS